MDRESSRKISTRVVKRRSRMYVTYCAIICDSAEIQAKCPQFLIANGATVRKRDLPNIAERLDPRVRLLRRRSAWLDQALLVEILRELARALVDDLELFQPILLMDAARHHISSATFMSARRMGFWTIIVPPATTGVLQPLDTHVFRRFKGALQHRCEQSRHERPEYHFGDLALAISVTIATVVLSRGGTIAFESNGFSDGQNSLSSRVRDRLELEAELEVSEAAPSAETLRLCFPQRCNIDRNLILAPLLPRACILRRRAPLVVLPPAMIYGRTRSETRRLRDFDR